MSDPAPSAPLVGPRETIYANEWMEVYRVRADYGGSSRDLYVTDYGVRAAVLVIRDGKVLLTRQRRTLIPHLSWEIPGGRAEAHESPEDAAARECAEETGYRPLALEPLLSFHPGLDTLHNPTHLFVVREFEGEPAGRSPSDEVVKQEWLPIDEAVRMVMRGQILDSLSIIALLTYAHKERETEERP